MDRRITLASLLVLVLAGWPALAADDEAYTPPEDDERVELTLGYLGSSTDDALHRVAEYDVTDPSSMTGLLWSSSPYEDTLFSLELDRLGSDELRGRAGLDLSRRVRVDAALDGLIHRLDHDPLTNLQAVAGIKVVRSTDLEPGVDYQIRRSLYEIHAELQPRTVQGLLLRMGYRDEQRDGTRQMLNTSHCTSCHTVAKGREIDQRTRDYTVGAHLARGRVDLDYELTGREFREDEPAPLFPYEPAFRPATPGSAPDPTVLIKPFNDRIWWQNTEKPANVIPEIRRTAHRFKARAALDDGDSLAFTIVQSTTENRTTGLEYDIAAYRGRYSFRPRETLRVHVYAQRDELDNEPALIDLLSLNGVSGAPITSYPGFGVGTFEDWQQSRFDPTLPFSAAAIEFDGFTRRSSLDRTDDRLGVDFFWRPSRADSFRAGYRYRLIDRDAVVLADGTGETEQHQLKLGWHRRVGRTFHWNNSLRVRQTDNPYVNVDGVWRAYLPDPADPTQPVDLGAGSPKNPRSLQYYQLHQLRIADVGRQPTDELKLRSNVTWSPSPGWALSGSVRATDSEHDELDWSTWRFDSFGVGANLWASAGPRFQFTLAADHTEQESEALIAVPVFDG